MNAKVRGSVTLAICGVYGDAANQLKGQIRTAETTVEYMTQKNE